jgi:hypothetical protein
MVDAAVMRCFYVLVHGRLRWRQESDSGENDPAATRPLGFYCHRYVLASGEGQAEAAAFRRVRENLEKQTGWIGSRQAALDLEAEELTTAPMYKLLRPDNRGHSFYLDE